MSFRRSIATFTLQLGFIIFIIGILLTILGIWGVFIYEEPSVDPETGELPPETLEDRIMNAIGAWKYWCVLLGPVLIIAGGWYFFDNLSKRREFKELMDTTSKAKFIKNLDRTEFLAWKLTPEHQKQFARKKKKFHIK